MPASSWWHEAKSPRSTNGLRGGVTGGGCPRGGNCVGVPVEGVPRSGPLGAPRMLLPACGP